MTHLQGEFAMKKRIITLIVILLTLLIGNISVHAADNKAWQTVGDANFTQTVNDAANDKVAMATENGVIYIAYPNKEILGKATVMKYDGLNWILVGEAGFSSGSAQNLTIDVSNGIPYVSYIDTGYAVVKMFDGTNWIDLGGLNKIDACAAYSAFIIYAGVPYLAYMDCYNATKISVKKYASNIWENVGTEGFSSGSGTSISICIDNGTLYVTETHVNDVDNEIRWGVVANT